MKAQFLLVALWAFLLPQTRGGEITETYASGVLSVDIPDDGVVLTPNLHRVTTSAITSLTEVQVALRLVGTGPNEGWAGDIYASLVRSDVGVVPASGDPYAVLLNRVGVTGANPAGHGYGGWDATFADDATLDVRGETTSEEALTGLFEPDGRTDFLAADRDAMLSSFVGWGGNGDWWLAIGDLEAGGTMRLVEWSLILTGESAVVVPEGGLPVGGLVAVASMAGVLVRRRRGHRG